MPATRWKNPYTALVKTKPQLLRPFCDNTVADDDVDFVKSALARFDTRFCEIGSGSGGHLIELARKHPGTLCIGFELRFKRIYRTAQKAEEAELNLSLIHI